MLERRMDNGSPVDDALRNLGVKFYEEFRGRRWCIALETFHRIEDRIMHLIELQMQEEQQGKNEIT
jgi:hypothetical protein